MPSDAVRPKVLVPAAPFDMGLLAIAQVQLAHVQHDRLVMFEIKPEYRSSRNTGQTRDNFGANVVEDEVESLRPVVSFPEFGRCVVDARRWQT